jgi:phosphate transport system substrate-binding protein
MDRPYRDLVDRDAGLDPADCRDEEHMTMRTHRALVALLAVLLLVAAACGESSIEAAGDETEEDAEEDVTEGEGAGGGDGGLTGEVVVSGSSTVEPVSALNAQKWNAQQPNVAISVDGPGSGDGFQIFCSGESDISDASRAIKQEEMDACEAGGIEFIELKVAIDGLSVITSTENDQVECLGFGDLYALLGPESTGFGTWAAADDLAAEIGDAHGELHTPYPDSPLVVTAPGEESGTFDSFVEIVLEDIADERGQDATSRPDYQSSPNDNVIVEGISGTPTSLGWVGYAFVQANPGAIKALAVDGGDGCVEPTPETIASGEFPIARPLFIYVNKAKAEDKPELAAFVDFYMSDDGFASVGEAGYVDLEDSVIAETRSVWESRETGTREG